MLILVHLFFLSVCINAPVTRFITSLYLTGTPSQHGDVTLISDVDLMLANTGNLLRHLPSWFYSLHNSLYA